MSLPGHSPGSLPGRPAELFPPGGGSPANPPPWRYLLAGTGVALVVLVGVLTVGGGAERANDGPFTPGPVTAYGLPVARLVGDLLGIAVVGLLLVVGVLLPLRERRLVPAARRALRLTALAALAWLAAGAGQVVLTLSDFAAQPPSVALTWFNLRNFLTITPQGRALVTQIFLVTLVALSARLVLTRFAANACLLTALVALVAPALAGHSASAADHALASSALLVHIIGVALWVGGLIGLGLAAWSDPNTLPVAVPRFSRLAFGSLVAVGASGAVVAWANLGGPSRLFTTSYGVFVLAKIAALGGLGYLGLLHRRRFLPAKLSQTPRVGLFVRLAAGEIALMGATVGLAVGLSRTPSPVPHGAYGLTGITPAQVLLGYPMPGPPTWGDWMFGMRPDGLVVAVVSLAAALYLSGVRALRRRGDRWPASRVAGWLGGLVVALVVTCGGLGRYAPVLFSAHMVQHMVLNMLVPPLLVLGAPVTLALRTLPAGTEADPGPRTMLLGVLHSRVFRVLAHPGVAAGIFVSSVYGLYFTPAFGLAMDSHWGHLAMQLHFVLAGSLFFWVLIGVDPGPRRPPYLLRLLLLFVAMAFHAFFSVALMSTSTVLASGYYQALARPWGGSLLEDQKLGAGIGWAFGEVPVVLVLAVLFAQWVRADERDARAADRAADRAFAAAGEAGPAAEGTDELSAYNRYLAALNQRAEADRAED